MTTTKKQLGEIVADRLGYPANHGQRIVQAVLDSIAGELRKGHRLELRGFAVLEPVVREAHPARNPRTGEPVLVPEKLDVRVQVSGEVTGAMRPAHEWPRPPAREKRQPWWEAEDAA